MVSTTTPVIWGEITHTPLAFFIPGHHTHIYTHPHLPTFLYSWPTHTHTPTYLPFFISGHHTCTHAHTPTYLYSWPTCTQTPLPFFIPGHYTHTPPCTYLPFFIPGQHTHTRIPLPFFYSWPSVLFPLLKLAINLTLRQPDSLMIPWYADNCKAEQHQSGL